MYFFFSKPVTHKKQALGEEMSGDETHFEEHSNDIFHSLLYLFIFIYLLNE